MRLLRYSAHKSFALLACIVCSTTTTTAAELADLVAGDVKQVMSDCKFTEGPAWHPDGYLLFTDIPNNRIVRVLPDGSHNDWMTDSQGANGLMCDQQGNVYAAQGDAQRVVRLKATASGETGELADVLTGEFEGKPFNKPNDLALDTFGGLYFTDPNYSPKDPAQPVEGVYYLSAEKKVTRVVDDLPRPNGVLVSADGKHLYVANINLRKIMRYEIVGPGQISSGEVIFTGDETLDGGGPDGMSLDEQGNIYATYKSLVVLTADGELIGRIEVPENPANCTFGGPDSKTLYVTARTSLYSIPMQVAGIALRAAGPGVTGAADPGVTKTREFKAGPLTLQVPESWKQEPPSNRLRLAQFTIPAAEGDDTEAELVLSGPFGGTAQDNVQRWIGQFDEEGRELKMTKGETEQGDYILVDLSGTYHKSVGPPIRRQTKTIPDARMLGVMFMANEGGNYFFKLDGPQKTVSGAAEGLRQSFGGDASKESEYTLE
ncbi:MAG: SMP-30/gluconolactonase/LRE family protein [Planctomycetaceae bacterium]|nr:SMP-30/gluconolactonase/LRE family protein [Planctomycetaceae bacterium]